jgi:hypothetical protein
MANTREFMSYKFVITTLSDLYDFYFPFFYVILQLFVRYKERPQHLVHVRDNNRVALGVSLKQLVQPDREQA